MDFFFFLSFAVTFILENFHRGGEVKWPFFQKPLDNFSWKFGNSILMPLTLCIQKEFLIESKLNGFWFFFSVTFGLRNFHRGGEVKWAFFQKSLDNFLWKFGKSILMPLTLCTQNEFLIESNLNGFFFLLLDLETFIGEREHFTR